MFKAEWEYLKKHKFFMLVIVVLFFVPSIYAVTFLSSLWDPYGQVKNLPVAVVNKDKSVNYEGQKLAVGDDLEKELRKSKAMDFHFPSEEEAKAGLKDGKYYTVITIPSDFSKDATTLLDKEPKQMKLDYETSSGRSFIAGKLSESGAKEISQNVSEQVTKTYAKTIFAEMKKVGKGMGTAADANKQLADGTTQIKSGSDQLTSGLQTLSASTLQFNDGAQTLTQGLSQYVDGVAQADSGSQQVTAGLGQLNSQVPALVGGVSQLANGSNQVTAGLGQLNSQVPTLAGGVSQLTNGSNQLTAGIGQLNSQVPTLVGGVNQLAVGGNTLTSGVQQYTAGVNQAASGSEQLANGVDQLNQQLKGQDFEGKITTLQTQVAMLQDIAKDMPSNEQLQAQLQTAQTHLDNLNKATADDAASMPANVDKAFADAGVQVTSEQKAKIVASLTADVNNSETSKQIEPIVKDITALSAQINAFNNAHGSQITQLAEAANNTDLNDVNMQLEQMKALPGAINTLDEKTHELSAGLNQLVGKSTDLQSGATQLNNGLNALNGETSDLSNGTNALMTGATQLNNGLNMLNGKTSDLSNGVSALTNGSTQVSDGLNTLNGKTGDLSNGASQLLAGSSQLTTGLDTLNSKRSELNSGAGQLADGARQLNGGANQLTTGAEQLSPALAQVQTGNQTLADKMGSAAKQVNDTKATNKTFKQIAAPATAKQTEKDHVANNGTGMVPYMFSVAMFVGMMALNLMLDMISPRTKISSLAAWMGSKMVMLFGIAVMAATVLYGLSISVLGLDPIHPLQTYGFMILISLMDAALVTAIYMWFDKAGAFAAMVLLVFQLSGSAGTYPIQLSNAFFEWLHPYLPMTYTVDGLRETIMIGGSAMPQVEVLFSIFVVSIIAMVIYYVSHRRHYSMMQDIAEA